MRYLVLVLTAIVLASCGGGGGGSSLRISFSTSTIDFAADAPWAQAADDQQVVGTLSGQASGILYVLVQVNDPVIATATDPLIDPLAGNGRVTVVAGNPATLGPGVHQGTIVIRACLNDPTCNSGQVNGSPHTVHIRYEVADPVVVDSVSPSAIEAGTTGTVILRGHGFAPATTVTFGGVSATSVTYVSATELRVAHPALAAGARTVLLDGGAVPFTATLAVVDTPAYPADFIPHPGPGATFPTSLVYDARHSAILLTEDRETPNANQLVRYAYVGGDWSPAGAIDFEGKLLGLSLDGSRLLAAMPVTLSFNLGTIIVEFDPVTLGVVASTTISAIDALQGAALVNHGHLLLAMSGPGDYPLAFDTVARTATPMLSAPHMTSLFGSGDGGTVVGNSFDAARYDASTYTWTDVAGSINTGYRSLPTADIAGNRFQAGAGVYDRDLNPLGYANNSPGVNNVAAVMNTLGTRLYTFTNLGTIRTYDLTVPATGGGQFPGLVELGAPVTLSPVPGGDSDPPPQMAITPDGAVLVVAGTGGISIQPLTP